jgi:hypothetical protein
MPWRLLRKFLISRLTRVKEDPDSRRWAQDFIKAGGTTRMAVWMLLMFLGMCTALGVTATSYEIATGVGSSFAENPRGWTCSFIGLGSQILGMVICVVYLRRDWLRG